MAEASHNTSLFSANGRRVLLAILALCAGLAAQAQAPQLAPDIPMLERPWSNDAEKFSFVILGDKTSGGEGKWPIYDRAVDAINLLDPDFVVTVGDMIPGHMDERSAWDAEWAEYMAHAQRIASPVFFTVGNHDIANLECYQFWQEDFGRTYYSFDYKDCHFLILNSEEERIDGRGPAWEKMMAWMKEDLQAASAARHTFVFFHKPMWADPRFLRDWARVEKALGARPFTVVAGHEHYHSTEMRNGNRYVIQSATGGGIHLSGLKRWGGFHGFGFVTVDGDEVAYAVVEPEGGVWPVDIAPASFRKAITYDVVRVDALPGADFSGDRIELESTVALHNVLDARVTLRVRIEPLAESGWNPVDFAEIGWTLADDALEIERTLEKGEREELHLSFEIPGARVSFPPAVEWSVQYDGHWVDKEAMRMVEVNTLPLYPNASLLAPQTVWVAGPFDLGPIDTRPLPEDPAASNPNFYHEFGPEAGVDPERLYEGLHRWSKHDIVPRGLFNANAILGTQDFAAAYVACFVYSPHAQRTHAVTYADNFCQTYLNGVLIDSAQNFGAPGGFVYPPLHLRKGWNTLMVKLINNRADWFLRLLIADPEGNLKLSGEDIPDFAK